MEEFYKQAADFIKVYEGYVSKAMWDVNAWRLGHGSDTITFPDGSFRKVLQTDVTNREMAAKDLARRIKKDFEPKVIRQIGADYYNRLPANARIALIDYAYNYGSITKPIIIKMARTGDVNAIGKAIFDSTINDMITKPYYKGSRRRRKAEWDLAIKPNPIDKELLNPGGGKINSSNIFFFTIIAGAIYFMLQQSK